MKGLELMQRDDAPDMTSVTLTVAADAVSTSVASRRARAQSEAIKRQVREQFGRSARAYVESAYHAHGSDLARLVALAEPRPTDRALDISAGGGHTALALAPHVTHVTASDLTPTMLTAARTFLASRGTANVA
jgi:protein-L-isoaspartate O-methyltransferase